MTKKELAQFAADHPELILAIGKAIATGMDSKQVADLIKQSLVAASDAAMLEELRFAKK